MHWRSHHRACPGSSDMMEMEDRKADLTIVGPGVGIRDYVTQSARMMKTGFSYPIHYQENKTAGRVWESSEHDYEVHA